MLVETQVNIHAPRAAVWAAVWAAVTDVEQLAGMMTGVETIEVLDKPAQGLVGLKWRETRILFGKPASAGKWITEAWECAFYKTRAEDGGFVFVSTLGLSDAPGGATTLTNVHDSLPQTLAARLMAIPMRLFFKGVARKALLRDLNDIKAAVERR